MIHTYILNIIFYYLVFKEKISVPGHFLQEINLKITICLCYVLESIQFFFNTET